jgi:hypothetical protein
MLEGYVCRTFFDFEYDAGYVLNVYPSIEKMKKCVCCEHCGYYKIKMEVIEEFKGIIDDGLS